MAFDFGSDILVDAMRAASPKNIADAKLRFENIATPRNAVAQNAFELGVSRGKAATSASNKDSRAQVMQKFEAVVLSTFVQAMMPKNATSVYGEGLAGDMWKAQMAEKIAQQITRSGGIGIASRLLGDYHKNGDQVENMQGVRDVDVVVDLSRSSDVATRIVQHTELELLRENEEKDS